MPRFCYEPGRLSVAAHLSANPFVDTMRADKPEGSTYKQVGDYLLPDVEVLENPEVGFGGMQRRKDLLEHLTDDLPSVRCFVLWMILLSERFDNDFNKVPDRLIQPLIIEDTHIQSLVPVM